MWAARKEKMAAAGTSVAVLPSLASKIKMAAARALSRLVDSGRRRRLPVAPSSWLVRSLFLLHYA